MKIEIFKYFVLEFRKHKVSGDVLFTTCKGSSATNSGFVESKNFTNSVTTVSTNCKW